MLIGITGKRRAGKDTAGKVLIDHYGFERYSLAKPLKLAAIDLFQFSRDQVFGDKKDDIDLRLGVRPRKILDVLGSHLIFEDIYNYIPELEEKIPKKELLIYRFKWWYEKHKNQNIVISDVRFKHESVYLKKLGAIIIKIKRPGYKREGNSFENDVDQIKEDFLIVNNKSVESLQKEVRELFEKKIKP